MNDRQLMKNGMLIGGTIFMLAATSALAEENAGDLYRASELSLDAFGSASLGKYSIENLSGSRVRHDTRLGAGRG